MEPSDCFDETPLMDDRFDRTLEGVFNPREETGSAVDLATEGCFERTDL